MNCEWLANVSILNFKPAHLGPTPEPSTANSRIARKLTASQDNGTQNGATSCTYVLYVVAEAGGPGVTLHESHTARRVGARDAQREEEPHREPTCIRLTHAPAQRRVNGRARAARRAVRANR